MYLSEAKNHEITQEQHKKITAEFAEGAEMLDRITG
jgi:hypothetical protein